MNSDSFSRTYIRGELLTQFWNALVKGAGLANSFLILTALSVYQFGLYQLVLAALAIAESFSAGLFDDVVVNDVARGLSEKRPAGAKRLFNEFAVYKAAVGIGLSLLLFSGSESVAAYYGEDIGLFVAIASVLVAVNALTVAQEIFFIATVSFSGLGIQAVQEVSKFFLLLGFLSAAPFGIREALLAAVLSAFLALLVSSFFFLREYRAVFRGVVAERGAMLWREFTAYGRWVYLRYAVAKVSKNIRPWLIKFFLNTEAVALWALAVHLITLAQSVFPVGMLGRLMPWEVARPERFRFIFARSIKYVLWGGALLALGGFFIVPPLISFIFPKYAPAMPIFRLLLLTLPLYGVYKIHKSVLTVLREQKILATRLITESVAVVGLSAILLPLAGLSGAATELIATYAWRVWLLHAGLKRAHPMLAVKPRSVFRFDAADLLFFKKAAGHLFFLGKARAV